MVDNRGTGTQDADGYLPPFTAGPFIVGGGAYWARKPTNSRNDPVFAPGRLIARPAEIDGDGVQGKEAAAFYPATIWVGRQGMNDRGEILGAIQGINEQPQGTGGFPAIWRNGRGHSLTGLVATDPETSPYTGVRGNAINDHGVIAGTAINRHDGTRVPVLLIPIDIEPDANMSGVVGDVVKSAKAGSTVKHFVTPRKSTELNQEYVILKAVGVTVDQITDGNASQIVEWDGGLPTDPPDPLKRRVKRDATGNGPTEVKIKTKQGGTVAVQMDVWVVWCTMNAQHSRFGPAVPAIYEDQTVFEGKPNNGNWFRFIIHPAAIVSPQADAEIPDLKGAKRKPVPGDGKPFTIHMRPNPPVGDTAANKWDVSRQYSITISNPNLIPLAQLAPELFPAWLVGQPNAADQTPVNFPADPAEGNDDPSMNDEDTNPYQERLTGQLSHSQGELSSFDAPGYSAPHIWGTVHGMKFGVRYSFREFVRLELWDGKRQSGKFWFRISDDNPWHFTFKVKFTDPLPVGSPYPKAWVDDGSEQNFGP